MDELTLSNPVVSRSGKSIIVGGSAGSGPHRVVLCTGPNGSGKTTLLEALAGILPMTSGHIRWGGNSVNPAAEQWRADTAYLPADGGTIPVLTIAEQLRLMLELRAVPYDESERRIDLLAGVFGLAAHLHKRADTLSTGTKKRLGLALLAATPSPRYLLDEPSAGLDANGVAVLLKTISLLARSGALVIVASNAAGVFAGAAQTWWRIRPGADGAALVDDGVPVSGGPVPDGRPASGEPADLRVELPWLAL